MSTSRVYPGQPNVPGSLHSEHHDYTDPAMASWMVDRFRSDPRDSQSPTKAILTLGAVLVPLSLLPYLLVRRQFLALRKDVLDLRRADPAHVRELRAIAATLATLSKGGESSKAVKLLEESQKLLAAHKAGLAANTAVVEANARKLKALGSRLDELHTMVKDARTAADSSANVTKSLLVSNRKALEENKRALEPLERDLNKVNEAAQKLERMADMPMKDMRNQLSVLVAVERDRAQKAKGFKESALKRLDRLLQINEHRVLQARDVKALGTALADVAAFMEESEMRQGWTPRPDDGRGIDRMRSLAQRLDELGSSTTQRQETAPSKEQLPPEPTEEESGAHKPDSNKDVA